MGQPKKGCYEKAGRKSDDRLGQSKLFENGNFYFSEPFIYGRPVLDCD